MKSLITALSLVLAGPAIAGPDFHTKPARGDEAVSPGTREILPTDDVIFGLDSAVLTDGAKSQLDTVAKKLRVRKDLKLVVEGYADRIGDAQYNVSLSRQRANAVRSHLIRRGVGSDRIVLAMFGESHADPSGNPLDRRAVLWVSPLPVKELSAKLIEKRALQTTWTVRGTLHAEQRTPVVISRR